MGETSLPRSVDYGLPCYYLIAPAEASSNLARYDGVRYGLRVADGDYHEMVERTRDEGFGDEPKRRIMLGAYALSAGYYEAFYGQAQKVRTVIADEHAAAFEDFDVLVSPTSPTVAFPLGAKTPGPARDVPLRPADDPVLHGRPARASTSRAASPRAFRSASSSSARSSPRTRSSASATRSSGRSTSTTSRSGCDELGSRSSGWRSTST